MVVHWWSRSIHKAVGTIKVKMYYSVYKIITDTGIYVGQTINIEERMAGHYSNKIWKKGPGMCRLPIYNAIVTTPDEKLRVEELGFYKIENRKQINNIEKYWIARTGANLNVIHRHRKRTLYLDELYNLEKTLRITRTQEQQVTLDMKYQFDLMMVTCKLQKLSLDELHEGLTLPRDGPKP
jgi:hypothetical protein